VLVGFVAPLAESPDAVPLLMQLVRPRHVAAADAVELTADLLVTAPKDESGRVWLTEISMANPEDDALGERHFLALMDVVTPILSARHGYLVILSGGPEVVELEGVTAPEPLSPDDLPEPRPPGPSTAVFAGAVMSMSGDGDEGWRRVLTAVETLCSDIPGLAPDYIFEDDEWRPLGPTAESQAPQWWPMQQTLWAAQTQFTWQVDDGSGWMPDQPMCTIDGRGPAPNEGSPALGRGLAGLASGPLDYAYAHVWHPEEPWTPAGPRMTGDGPYIMLNIRDLAAGLLPNLYWLQILGPRWVERIGRARIASTPAYQVRELIREHWLIQLAPSLTSVTEDFAAFLTARDAAVAHLGPTNFSHLN